MIARPPEQFLGFDTEYIHTIDDDKFKAMVNDYKFDYKATLKNAIDCAVKGGGEPDMHDISHLESGMPRCFANFQVKNENEDGEKKGGPYKTNKFGYLAGSCGIHIRQHKPDATATAFGLQATLKDAHGEVLTSADWQAAKPTAVVKGKESNKDAKLPYDLYMASGVGPGVLENDTVRFWYSDKHWTSNESGKCKFADHFEGDTGVRDGDCNFECPDPTDKPPKSATADSKNPLPTALAWMPGQCGIHVYQKKDDSSNKIWANIRDGAGALIAYVTETQTVNHGDTMDIQGLLPHSVNISPSDERIQFKYNGDTWSSDHQDKHNCKVGDWEDDENRQMDCVFQCSH